MNFCSCGGICLGGGGGDEELFKVLRHGWAKWCLAGIIRESKYKIAIGCNYRKLSTKPRQRCFVALASNALDIKHY